MNQPRDVLTKKITIRSNMFLKQSRRHAGACNHMNLKVGTAGFEPTASCTPSKNRRFHGWSPLSRT